MHEAALTFAEIVSGARIIPLSQGKITFVDAEDFDELIQFKWHNSRGYASRNICSPDGRRTTVMMHRLLLGFPKIEVDHRDRNRSNNRRYNLREATKTQNRQNTGVRSDNRCGLKGVRFVTRKGKWVAMIRLHGKRKCLGYYPTDELAHAAYVAAAVKYHGEFACPN